MGTGVAITTASRDSSARSSSNDSAQRAAAEAVDGGDGVASNGPTGGAPIGTSAHRLLSDQERRRLVDAARVAFVATDGATTSYTVVPENIDDVPTVVSAAPAGRVETRAGGGVCRPLLLSATKYFRTTVGTPTFCQAPGSTELKVSTTI